MTVAVYLLNLLLYTLPGVAAAYLIWRRRTLGAIALFAVLLGTAAVLGYAGFWIFLSNKTAGRIFCYLVYLASLAIVVAAIRQRAFWRTIWPIVRDPLLLVGLGGILYLSLLFIFGDPAGQGVALPNVRFFNESRPGDNLIPLIFAERVYSHQPLRPFCCGDWLSSDRPPLQTGVVLLLRQFRMIGSIALNYQALSTLLQCLWIAGVWQLLCACGAGLARRRQVLVLLMLSGFYFYNSVFVWPKLFAAAFLLPAIAMAIEAIREHRALSFTDAALGGVSVSLALLAHPGSIFSLPAFGLAVVWNRKLFPWRAFCAAAIAPALLLSSWAAYQHWIDPPGNRLTKMHLAGVGEIDSRTLEQALADAYRSLSWRTIADYKWSNVRNLMGTDPLIWKPLSLDQEKSRIAQREYISSAVGLLNIGWIGLLLWRFRGNFRSDLKPFAWLLPAGIFNLVVWSLALFGPHATYTTHSSYADILLVTISLAMFLVVELPRAVSFLVLGLQVLNLLLVWTWPAPSKYFPHPHLVPWFVASALASIAVLIWIFARESRALEQDPWIW